MKPRSLFLPAVAVSAVLLVSCGSSSTDPTETFGTRDSASALPGDESTTTVSTTVTVPTTVDDGIVRIDVTVGVDSGPDRIEEASIGDAIELTMLNPDEDDEFHVHGFDLGGDETPTGEEKVFAFTATEAGDYEVESHVTGEVLVVIRVS
jgi:hypothetical protein